MKELLENYITLRKEFEDKERSIEKTFGEFLESNPDWRDLLASIIIAKGYSFPKDESLGDILIPEVRDINLCGDRVSFKIRIPSDTWVKEFIEVPWLPFEWLTNPEVSHLDKKYLEEKIKRRQESLKEYMEDRDYAISQIKETEDEIERIKKLIEKKGL